MVGLTSSEADQRPALRTGWKPVFLHRFAGELESRSGAPPHCAGASAGAFGMIVTETRVSSLRNSLARALISATVMFL